MTRLVPALLVAWKGTFESNPAPHLVDHYVLIVQKITPKAETVRLSNGVEVVLPKCETVARARMTIGEGEKLIAQGMRPGGAWFTGKKHRKR